MRGPLNLQNLVFPMILLSKFLPYPKQSRAGPLQLSRVLVYTNVPAYY